MVSVAGPPQWVYGDAVASYLARRPPKCDLKKSAAGERHRHNWSIHGMLDYVTVTATSSASKAC